MLPLLVLDQGKLILRFCRVNWAQIDSELITKEASMAEFNGLGMHMGRGQQYGLVGRGRDQILPGRRRGISDNMRTGTEDYFCGSYNFDVGKENGGYREFTTPHAGLPQVIRPDGLYDSQTRFGLYRWHIMDPVRFEQDLRITMQALGWRSGRRYLPLQDDIASVAYWYQTLPAAPFPELPDRDSLEVI
jgi:hypothetical protein